MYIHMDATSKETPKLANDGKMVKEFMATQNCILTKNVSMTLTKVTRKDAKSFPVLGTATNDDDNDAKQPQPE